MGMKSALLPLLTAWVMCAQVKSGDPAPPIVAPPLDASRPFPGWATYRGDFVVVDFWATWCGPCLPGLDKIVSFEKEFRGRGVRFLTVALDTVDRVRQYYRDKGIAVATFVEGEHSPTAQSFGVRSVPGAALIDREGRIVGVTSGENITAEVLRKALAGEEIKLPPFERSNNVLWDREEITWQDGVLPEFAVLIKPMAVSGGGYAYKPGSNHVSGDGASLQAMIQAAWRTDSMHLDLHAKLPGGTYRFAVTIPQGREAELFPAPGCPMPRLRHPGPLGGSGARRFCPQPRSCESSSGIRFRGTLAVRAGSHYAPQAACRETCSSAAQLDGQARSGRNRPFGRLRLRPPIPRRRSQGPHRLTGQVRTQPNARAAAGKDARGRPQSLANKIPLLR